MVVRRTTAGGLVVYAAEVDAGGRVLAWTADRDRAAELSPAADREVLGYYEGRPCRETLSVASS